MFGGDSLAVEAFDDRSVSPVDPNDKYSIFRSYEKKRTTSSNQLSIEPITSSSESSLASKGGLLLGNEAAKSEQNSVYGDFKAGGVSESSGGWADFQSVVSSAAPTFVEFASEQQQSHVGASILSEAPSMPINSDDDFGSFQTTEANNTALNISSNMAEVQSTSAIIGSNKFPSSPFDSACFSSQQHGSASIDLASFQKSNQAHVPVSSLPQSTAPDFKADFGEFASVPKSSQDSAFNVINPPFSADISSFSSSSGLSNQDGFAEFRSTNVNTSTGSISIFPSIDITANLSQNTPTSNSFRTEPSSNDNSKSMASLTADDLQSTEVNASLEEIVNRMDESWDDFTSFTPVPGNEAKNFKKPGALAISGSQSNSISTSKKDMKHDIFGTFGTSASSNENTKFREIGKSGSSDSKESEILSAFGTQDFSDNTKDKGTPNIDLSKFSALSVSYEFEPMQKLQEQELMKEGNAKMLQQKSAGMPKMIPNPMAFDIMPQKHTTTAMTFDNFSEAEVNQDEFADFSSHTSAQTNPTLKDTFNSNSQVSGIFPSSSTAPTATVIDDDFADFTSSEVHATDIFQSTSQEKFSEFGQDRGSILGPDLPQSTDASGQGLFSADDTVGGSRPSDVKTAYFGAFSELEVNNSQLPADYSAGLSKEVSSAAADNKKELNIKAFADFGSTESSEVFTFGKLVSATDSQNEAVQSQRSYPENFSDFDAFKSKQQVDPVALSFAQDRAFTSQPNKAINSADQLGNFAASFNAGRVDEIVTSQQQQQLQHLQHHFQQQQQPKEQQQEFAKPRLTSNSSQENFFVEPALEAEDRYKALTGVLEVRSNIIVGL